MITYRPITTNMVNKLNEIDRSEFIDVLYHVDEDQLNQTEWLSEHLIRTCW